MCTLSKYIIFYSNITISLSGEKNGNMICRLVKAEFRLFEGIYYIYIYITNPQDAKNPHSVPSTTNPHPPIIYIFHQSLCSKFMTPLPSTPLLIFLLAPLAIKHKWWWCVSMLAVWHQSCISFEWVQCNSVFPHTEFCHYKKFG